LKIIQFDDLMMKIAKIADLKIIQFDDLKIEIADFMKKQNFQYFSLEGRGKKY